MPDKKKANLSNHRIQTSFLAGPEKKALLWFAPRMPPWVTPDLLTFFGLLGMGVCGISYYFATRHWIFLVLASVGHIINWFGDSLDGTLARYRNQQRPKYGYYIDHLVDAFGIALMTFGLAYSGLVRQPFIWVFLSLFFIASINTYLATNSTNIFKISYLKFSTTEARVALIIMNTILIFVQHITILGFRFRWLNVASILISIFLLIAIIRSAYKNLKKLNIKERALWEEKSKK